MRGNGSMRRWVGTSAIALAAALSSGQALACSAEPGAELTITCPAGDPAAGPFLSSYTSNDTSSAPYDGNGVDHLIMDGGAIAADGASVPVSTGFPGDVLDASTGDVNLLGGNDVVDFRSGTIGAVGAPLNLDLGEGDNRFNAAGATDSGTLYGSLIGRDGIDTFDIGGSTTITTSVFTNGGADVVTLGGLAVITGTADEDAVGLGDGDDRFTMTSGHLGAGLSGGDGNDTLDVQGGSIAGYVNGGAGNDGISITGGAGVGGDLLGGAGNDTVTIDGGTVDGYVSTEDGDDQVFVRGGAIGTAAAPTGVTMGAGIDTLTMSGGTIYGPVAGDGGYDSVDMTGGTIQGGIDAEHVHLSGGTLTGDISGIGPNTLVIDGIGAVDPLNLRDGVLFSGTGANGTVTGVDLANGGAKRQNFTGFDNLVVDGSTLAFAPGSTQQINALTLQNASTLYAPGSSSVTGAIDATNSTINMVNGVAGDVFTLGGIALHGSTLAIDLNQQTGQADQLVAAAFGATGANFINVNLIGTPAFAGETDIPIIVSSGAPVPGTFTITGIPGTPGALFSYSVLQAPGGGLIVRATPNNFGIVVAPDAAVNASIVDVAVEALYGINRDAIDADLLLANGAQRIAITPSFGIFASGQFAHTEHDGYDISSGIFGGTGPSFDANDFSAAISLDFNAAKHFEFDKQYGLNLGVFAGYASTDVGLDPFLGFANMGGGTNRSGMFGGYALFRKEFTYALVSASAFLGNTDVENGVFNTTGSYDTKGYAVTGSVGHIFLLGDRTRLDLRGGVLGVTFRGDSYTDSGGNKFGESRISFGALQFAPGIYGDFQVGDGMVFSPYARLELQQRFNARNTAEIDTRTVNFDDADFSAALSGGFNLKMSQATTLSGEVRGKWSADSSTIGAKLGLKVAF